MKAIGFTEHLNINKPESLLDFEARNVNLS